MFRLKPDGWSAKSIAESQLIHEKTVLIHIMYYLKDNKIKPENGGSENYLNAEQTQELVEQGIETGVYKTRNLMKKANVYAKTHPL